MKGFSHQWRIHVSFYLSDIFSWLNLILLSVSHYNEGWRNETWMANGDLDKRTIVPLYYFLHHEVVHFSHSVSSPLPCPCVLLSLHSVCSSLCVACPVHLKYDLSFVFSFLAGYVLHQPRHSGGFFPGWTEHDLVAGEFWVSIKHRSGSPATLQPWHIRISVTLLRLWWLRVCLQIQLFLQLCCHGGNCTNKATGWAGKSVGGNCLCSALSCPDYVINLFEHKQIGNVSTDRSSALPFIPLKIFSTFGLYSFQCTKRSWLIFRLSQTEINLLKFSPLLIYCFYFW